MLLDGESVLLWLSTDKVLSAMEMWRTGEKTTTTTEYDSFTQELGSVSSTNIRYYFLDMFLYLLNTTGETYCSITDSEYRK